MFASYYVIYICFPSALLPKEGEKREKTLTNRTDWMKKREKICILFNI
jgi:hypothetical protein